MKLSTLINLIFIVLDLRQTIVFLKVVIGKHPYKDKPLSTRFLKLTFEISYSIKGNVNVLCCYFCFKTNYYFNVQKRNLILISRNNLNTT